MSKIKRFRVEPVFDLPPERPPGEWGESLRSIQGEFIFPLPCPAEEALSRILEGNWVCFAHYVYREKWDKKHKIPDHTQHTQLFGEYLLAILELCVQMHPIHPLGQNYKNASKWFDSICWELKALERQSIYSHDAGIKKLVENYRAIIFDYRAFMNPHQESPLHLCRLVNAVISTHEKKIAPNLINSYWSGFFHIGNSRHYGLLKSLSSYITYLDRNGRHLAHWRVNDGQPWYQTGQGKSRTYLDKASIKFINRI